MIVYPNAKLNLGLFVTGRRSDGYHLLETAFLPIPLCDTLELELSDADEDELIVTGGVETGALQDNLVLRAVRALRQLRSFPSVRLCLTKQIPSGAGMGGGSADASFTLTAINELCSLGLSTEELEAIALTLGADCPIFVRNQPAVGRGIGEVLTPLTLHLKGYHLTIVKPPIHISTAEAFLDPDLAPVVSGVGVLTQDADLFSRQRAVFFMKCGTHCLYIYKSTPQMYRLSYKRLPSMAQPPNELPPPDRLP